MTKSKPLNAKNLEALGAERLATLLLSLTEGNAVAKRKLKLELASTLTGGTGVAAEVRKRLATLRKARSFVDWRKNRSFVQDLQTQLQAILDHVAPHQPKEAFDLLWQLLEMAPALYERCDDSNGEIGQIMADALIELGKLAPMAELKPADLVDRVFNALCDNDYAQFDNVLDHVSGVLGQKGLSALKVKFETLAKNPPKPVKDEERKVIGWGSMGPIYDDQLAIRRHENLIQSALADIADAMGDADSFIGHF
jgi:hypothetical protein